MFLIPETAISVSGMAKLSDVKKTAQRFGASYRAVAYHFEHLGLLDEPRLAEILSRIPHSDIRDPEFEDLD